MAAQVYEPPAETSDFFPGKGLSVYGLRMRGWLRRHATYSNVVSTVCLFVILGGTSYAAVTITGKNVKQESLTGEDVKDGSLLRKDFKKGQLPAGEQGPAGAQGPVGAKGDPGTPPPPPPRGRRLARD
jgi:hypothetical protein